MIRRMLVPLCLALGVFAGAAHAQTPNAFGSIMTLPVVAQTSTFTTEIYVHNPALTPTSYIVHYIGAIGTLNAGLKSCPIIIVPAGGTAQYSLASICASMSTTGPNFGRLEVIEQDAASHPFALYGRMQSFSGDGFSIEGFPLSEFDNTYGPSYVSGLKRIAAAPGYQSNCFIGSTGEPVTVNYTVTNGAGTTLGAPQQVVLAANGYLRILDVFAAVGASPGDYTNGRINFVVPTGTASFIGFCTVQNNTTFDADFRIAKATNGNDESRQPSSFVTYSAGATQDLGGNLIPAPVFNPVTGVEHNWGIFLRHPDYVTCGVSSAVPAGEADLELIDPDGNIVAGGHCSTSFPKFNLGLKSTRNGGRTGQWVVKVGGCSANVTVTAYSLVCYGGSGVSALTYGGKSVSSF